MKIYKVKVSETAVHQLIQLSGKRDTTELRLIKKYIDLGVLIDRIMEEDPPSIYIKQENEIRKFVID